MGPHTVTCPGDHLIAGGCQIIDADTGGEIEVLDPIIAIVAEIYASGKGAGIESSLQNCQAAHNNVPRQADWFPGCGINGQPPQAIVGARVEYAIFLYK